MRLFFAIEISPDVRSAIAELQEALRPRLPSARWVAPANLHLTLRFLGECEPGAVEDLDAGLAASVRELDPFTLRFRGCGVFPNTSRARVLWIGVHVPDDGLLRLQSTVEDEVRALGFAPETRPFRPHLTIARFKKSDRALRALTPPLSEREFGCTYVSELILFESRLGRRGASYHVAERLPLGRSG